MPGMFSSPGSSTVQISEYEVAGLAAFFTGCGLQAMCHGSRYAPDARVMD